jgi:erythromycin esterase
MGEATHGTREFFQLKHRLLEFLVTEMGFTVFALEANWPESLAVNRYVLTGEGDPVEALNGLHLWTVGSQEVLDMVRWMRAYNPGSGPHAQSEILRVRRTTCVRGGAQRCRFPGPDRPRCGEEFARATEDLRAQKTLPGAFEFDRVSDDQRRQFGTIAEELVRSFDAKREQYISMSSEAGWKFARQNAVTMKEAAKANQPGVRDRFMAENVKWILDQEEPGAKIALWAHNNHVQTLEPRGSEATMGMHLRRMFGDATLVVGFAFNQGEFRAVNATESNLRAYTALPASADSLDAALTYFRCLP